MKTVKDFVGNELQIHKICDWLTNFYHHPEKDIPRYVIIQGNSGNGKTYLGELLANTFKVELFRITPLDIESKDSFNEIVKSINIKTLEGKNLKLIFIDDIDEFSNSYRSKLYEIVNISKYPIIYTTKTFSVDKDFYQFSKDALVIKLMKPYTSEIINYIKDKLPFQYDKAVVEKIIKESKSFRSIILSIYNMQINDLTNPSITKAEWLSSISRRCLKDNLKKDEIKYIFDSIRGYDKKSMSVMLKLAEFDYRVSAKFEKAKGESYPTIDKHFVNNMEPPIQKVMLKYQYKKQNNNSKPNAIKKIKKDLEVKSKKTTSSVDKWI